MRSVGHRYTSWFDVSISLNRTMVLAADEGVLLVHDILDVGTAVAAAALQAGPVWHFSPTLPPVVSWEHRSAAGNLSWAMSQGAPVNLFVAIDLARPDRGADDAIPINGAGQFRMGVQTLDVWSKRAQRSAFGSAVLDCAGRWSFVSVLVPSRAVDTPASPLGNSGDDDTSRSFDVAAKQTKDGAHVSVTVSWPLSRCASNATYCGSRLQMIIDADSGAWSVTRNKLEIDT